MFTGIIKALGQILSIQNLGDGKSFKITSPFCTDLKIGDSIAVNGCCLTVTELDSETCITHAVNETLQKTNLGLLHQGSFVNLELPLHFGGKLDGHLVQGHVDTTGLIENLHELQDHSWVLTISLPPQWLKYVIYKGSIAIDGISLTIMEKTSESISIAIIPHTYQNTNLKFYKKGDVINVECDMMGKYIENFSKHLGTIPGCACCAVK